MIEAIVACAGSGSRLKSRMAKPLVKLAGVPIFIRTLKALSSCGLIDKIILVVKKEELARFAGIARKFHLSKIKAIIPGGKTRSHSVRNGLRLLDKKTRLVVIHDGVRPFINQRLILAAIKSAQKSGAAILAVPVKATIKQAGSSRLEVEKTLDRKLLWEVQTPQVFKKDIILKAYKHFSGTTTDDASLVEKLGRPVKIVMGSYCNIKITTPEDLRLAETLLKRGASNGI
jgi:2-C-methyl-D-erythritol 4-phosphate cytidylyltransferase